MVRTDAKARGREGERERGAITYIHSRHPRRIPQADVAVEGRACGIAAVARSIRGRVKEGRHIRDPRNVPRADRAVRARRRGRVGAPRVACRI